MADTKNYNVTRQFASEILNISLRTLDRYAKKKNISSVRRGRQLYFLEDELLSFKTQLMEEESTKIKSQTPKKEFPEVEQAQAREQMVSTVESVSEFERNSEQGFENKIYKSLYEESALQVKELQKKCDTATYHIGQLEAQLKTMVPLLEYTKKGDEIRQLAEENSTRAKTITHLEKSIKVEQMAKRVYAAFLWGICCLIPLLLILRLITE